MRSIIFWIIAIVLVAVAIAFSAFNQHHASIDLWPLDIALSIPLYLVVMVALACGFVSASHFSKCYRDFFGRTPRRERGLPVDPVRDETAGQPAI